MFTIVTVLILALNCIFCETNPKQNDMIDVEKVVEEYFSKLPSNQSKYVINEGISKMISRYFDGKLNAFPLFKVSIKFDRKPVKIPWTLDKADKLIEPKLKKRYQYIKMETTKNE